MKFPPQHEAVMADFMGSLSGLTLEEALLNVELDAASGGWPRPMVRELASRVRCHFAKSLSSGRLL